MISIIMNLPSISIDGSIILNLMVIRFFGNGWPRAEVRMTRLHFADTVLGLVFVSNTLSFAAMHPLTHLITFM